MASATVPVDVCADCGWAPRHHLRPVEPNRLCCVVEAEIERQQLIATCPTCRDIEKNYRGFGPPHDGSLLCESGSISSGGTRAHCSCDRCF